MDSNSVETRQKDSVSRETWIDCLKVVCAFLIVMQHSLVRAWLESDMNSPAWITVNAVMTLAKEGVPLFFMCSGYVMLRRKREIPECLRSVLHILLVYVMWMCVYGIYSAGEVLSSGEPIKAVAGAFLKKILFGHYHVWFLFVLMGLYLLTPVFYAIMQDRKSAAYVVILSFIATIVLPGLHDAGLFDRFEYTLQSFSISVLGGNIFYYLMGCYLGRYLPASDNDRNRRYGVILSVISVVAYVCINIATVYYDRLYGEVSGRFFDDKRVFGCIFVCLIYMSFRLCINPDRDDKKGIWQSIAVLGFPIYLMHPLLLDVGSGIFKSNVTDILIGVAVYAICLLVSWLLCKFRYTRILFVTGKK